MASGNSLGCNTTGVVAYNSTTAVFTASPVTQYDVLVGGASNAISSVGPGSSGQVLQSAGNSSNPSYSTATYPATATGTGKILRADGTNWAASTATYPNTAGTNGNVLTSDGTNWISSNPVNSFFQPNSIITLSDDFITYITTVSLTSVLSSLNWKYGVIPDSITTFNSTNPGVISFPALAATAANYIQAGPHTALSNAVGGIILGGGAITMNWIVRIPTLSNGTNRYILRFGLGDTITTSDQANGIYFEYSDNINSGNWVGKTASGSTRSTANSAIAAETTSFHNFKISINAAATSVNFYIDGTEIANSPLSSNIPTSSLFFVFTTICTAGTMAAASQYLDLFSFYQTLTTAR